jgi:hypothetical protein
VLKAFLKQGEVAEYAGVEVEWIRGKKAVMHIYEDGNEVETVSLHLLTERDQIIKVFEEKGFHKKTQEQIYKEHQLRRAQKDIEQLEESPFAGMMITYVSMGSVAVLALVCIRRSRTRRSRV